MKLIKGFIKTNRKSILAFLTVGALAAVINFGIFTLLFKTTHLNYEIITSIAYICSVIFHFTANRSFTFKSQNISMSHQLPKYSGMVLLNYVVTLLVMRGVVDGLQLSPYIGNIFAIGMTVGTGYLISKYWVFTNAAKT